MPEPHHYPPFPADGYAARWSTWDGDHAELLTLTWENEAWTATGRVEHRAEGQVGERQSEAAAASTAGADRSGSAGRPEHRLHVEYVIRLSPLWQVRQFLLFRDLPDPDLWLGTDGHGRWGEVNGAHRPDLDGALDLVLAVTPFTHALPIRRLALAVGHSVTLPVLTVDVETLALATITHTYARHADHAWSVTTPSARHRFDVDAHGVPLDVPGHFRRTLDRAGS